MFNCIYIPAGYDGSYSDIRVEYLSNGPTVVGFVLYFKAFIRHMAPYCDRLAAIGGHISASCSKTVRGREKVFRANMSGATRIILW